MVAKWLLNSEMCPKWERRKAVGREEFSSNGKKKNSLKLPRKPPLMFCWLGMGHMTTPSFKAGCKHAASRGGSGCDWLSPLLLPALGMGILSPLTSSVSKGGGGQGNGCLFLQQLPASAPYGLRTLEFFFRLDCDVLPEPSDGVPFVDWKSCSLLSIANFQNHINVFFFHASSEESQAI